MCSLAPVRTQSTPEDLFAVTQSIMESFQSHSGSCWDDVMWPKLWRMLRGYLYLAQEKVMRLDRHRSITWRWMMAGGQRSMGPYLLSFVSTSYNNSQSNNSKSTASELPCFDSFNPNKNEHLYHFMHVWIILDSASLLCVKLDLNFEALNSRIAVFVFV